MERKEKTPTKEPRETGREIPEKKHPSGTAVEERPDIQGKETEERRWKEGEPWKEGMKEEEERKKEEETGKKKF